MTEPQSKFEDFRMTHKLGEGTFSEVLKVKHKTNGKVYAMKRFRKRFSSTFEEIQNLREIQALRRLNPHNHVIQLLEVLFDQKHGVLALNFELMDCNLYELISKKSTVMTEARARNYFLQICKGMDYMHSKGIFHRDIKPENILIKDNTIKLADFGSCRGIHSKQPYTEYIATRWYRSPECLLCDGIYTYKMDIWGAGCVLYEIITKAPLFPGSNELDQLHKIHHVIGTPSEKLLKKMLGFRSKELSPEYTFAAKDGTGLAAIMPVVSAECLSLLQNLLTYDPDYRITAREILKHPFFKEYFESKTSVTKPPIATTLSTDKTHDKENTQLPPAPQPNHIYIKQKDPEQQPTNSLVKTHTERQPKHAQRSETDKDQADTRSISTNSAHSVSKKGVDERYPVGMRRRSKKDYMVNSYGGSKGSLTKLPSLKVEQKTLLDSTKVARKASHKEYVTLPMLPTGNEKSKEPISFNDFHLPVIHPK